MSQTESDTIFKDNIVYRYNEAAYSAIGFAAQRRYPNEEFCRFMGRNFFSIPQERRTDIRILELGCGSASNLWMVAKEGFSAHGIDLSDSAITLAEQMLSSYGQTADLRQASMMELPYEDAYFDGVFDVFSSFCLNKADFERTVSESARCLKTGGKFFIYTPGKNSDSWLKYAPAVMIDESTLNGIHRETAPYFPCPHPFRFLSPSELQAVLLKYGLSVSYLERISKSYRRGEESFEFIIAEAAKV